MTKNTFYAMISPYMHTYINTCIHVSGGVHAVSSGIQFSDFAKATGCRATANGGVVSLMGDSGALTIGGQVQFTGNAAGWWCSYFVYLSVCVCILYTCICIYIYIYI